jgi:hypothetical protein
MATEYTIKMVQNASYKLTITVDGVDLTNASAKMTFGNLATKNVSLVLTSSPVYGLTISGQTISVDVDESITKDDLGSGDYDLFAQLANGDRVKILRGKFSFEKSLGAG